MASTHFAPCRFGAINYLTLLHRTYDCDSKTNWLSSPIFTHFSLTLHTHTHPPPLLLPPLPIRYPWGLTATGTHLPAWPSAHDGTRARCATHTPPVARIGDFLFQACGRAAPWTLLPASSHTTTPERHDTLRRPKNQPSQLGSHDDQPRGTPGYGTGTRNGEV